MGDEQKQLTNEQKKQLKSQVKSTKQYREMMAYKNFFEGADKYFNQINDIQVNIIKENQKLLNELGDNLSGNFQIILNKHFSDKKSQVIHNIGDEEIDLTLYKNDDENNVDNISGLKDAVKDLINQSTDKEVTRILKNLLTKITPIIDTMGKNLKNYKLNTRFKNLLGEYNKLKTQDITGEAPKKAPENEKKNQKNENENENKPNKEVYAEKSTVEKGQEKLLQAGLFPVEAREKGLLPPEGESEKTKEKKPINREELQGIINQNALENSTDKFIEAAAEVADAMHLKPTEVTPKEKAEPEETTETKENKTLGAPTISNETNTIQENNTPKIDDKQYEYELLRTDYINKIEAQLVAAIRAINAVRTQEQEQKEKNKIKEEEKKKEKEAAEEEKKRKKEEKQRIKYEQATPKEKAKIDKKKEKEKEKEEKRIEEEKKRIEEERQKYEKASPAEKVKINMQKLEKKEKETKETKQEKATKKKVKKKLKNGETVTIEDLENKPKLEKNIDTNTNICKFLLKLLRKDESSINTKAITDIFMAHKMNEYRTNGKIAIDDENRIKIMGSDGKETLATDEDYKNIMLEMMFDDKSKTNSGDKKNNTKLENFKFARFLFRIYFIIKNNIPVKELDNPNKTHALDTEFETSYENMCIAANDTDHTQFSEALDFLNDEINETLNPKNSNEKTTKKPETDNSEFYKIIQECIPKLKSGNTSLKPTEVISRLLRECKQKDIANRLINNLKHPIFESSKYFNIEKNDTDLQF